MRISLPALLSLFVIVSHTLLSCVQRWHSPLIPLMLAVVCWVSANTAEQCCLYMWHHKLVVVPFKWKLEKLLLSLLPQFNLIHQSKYTFNWIAWLASNLIEYIFNLFRGSYLWSSHGNLRRSGRSTVTLCRHRGQQIRGRVKGGLQTSQTQP